VNGKIQSFTDLNTWQEGRKLVVMIYTLTKSFPFEEKYALVNQIRRAAISVTSNIAEGFGRKNYKEKIQFYFLSNGSLTEVYNQLIISNDLGYIKNQKIFNNIEVQITNVQRLLQGLITKSRSFL